MIKKEKNPLPYKSKSQYYGEFPEDLIKGWDCQVELGSITSRYGFLHTIRGLIELIRSEAHQEKDASRYLGEAHYNGQIKHLEQASSEELMFKKRELENRLIRAEQLHNIPEIEQLNQELIELGVIRKLVTFKQQ